MRCKGVSIIERKPKDITGKQKSQTYYDPQADILQGEILIIFARI
jgi:hypothetical protein